ncbi:hypothetical protein BGW38_004012, partial [Lunasporangiospora selenospora]
MVYLGIAIISVVSIVVIGGIFLCFYKSHHQSKHSTNPINYEERSQPYTTYFNDNLQAAGFPSGSQSSRPGYHHLRNDQELTPLGPDPSNQRSLSEDDASIIALIHPQSDVLLGRANSQDGANPSQTPISLPTELAKAATISTWRQQGLEPARPAPVIYHTPSMTRKTTPSPLVFKRPSTPTHHSSPNTPGTPSTAATLTPGVKGFSRWESRKNDTSVHENVEVRADEYLRNHPSVARAKSPTNASGLPISPPPVQVEMSIGMGLEMSHGSPLPRPLGLLRVLDPKNPKADSFVRSRQRVGGQGESQLGTRNRQGSCASVKKSCDQPLYPNASNANNDPLQTKAQPHVARIVATNARPLAGAITHEDSTPASPVGKEEWRPKNPQALLTENKPAHPIEGSPVLDQNLLYSSMTGEPSWSGIKPPKSKARKRSVRSEDSNSERGIELTTDDLVLAPYLGLDSPVPIPAVPKGYTMTDVDVEDLSSESGSESESESKQENLYMGGYNPWMRSPSPGQMMRLDMQPPRTMHSPHTPDLAISPTRTTLHRSNTTPHHPLHGSQFGHASQGPTRAASALDIRSSIDGKNTNTTTSTAATGAPTSTSSSPPSSHTHLTDYASPVSATKHVARPSGDSIRDRAISPSPSTVSNTSSSISTVYSAITSVSTASTNLYPTGNPMTANTPITPSTAGTVSPKTPHQYHQQFPVPMGAGQAYPFPFYRAPIEAPKLETIEGSTEIQTDLAPSELETLARGEDGRNQPRDINRPRVPRGQRPPRAPETANGVGT